MLNCDFGANGNNKSLAQPAMLPKLLMPSATHLCLIVYEERMP